MKLETCYVVECSAGDYKDYRTWIAGIFSNFQDAENLKNEILNQIEITKNSPMPYNIEDYNSYTQEQYEIFSKWQQKIIAAFDFNGVEVKMYPFDKPISSE